MAFINGNKPNLFGIGASKCGTTSFYHLLKRHPNICMSSKKETSYFALAEEKREDVDYEAFFAHCKDKPVIGEVSPIYSELHVVPWVPEKIYNFNPHANIVYLVRNPIERLKSAWKQTLSTGHWKRKVYKSRFGLDIPKMSLNFEEAIFSYPPFIESCKYWDQLKGYKKYFPDAQIKVIVFEDFINQTHEVINNVFDFLGLSPYNVRESEKQYNPSKGKQMVDPKLSLLLDSRAFKSLIKPLVPNLLKSKFERLIHKEVPQDFEIDDPIKFKIKEELESDINNILKYANKDIDFWDL